jgi:hypothetical protein
MAATRTSRMLGVALTLTLTACDFTYECGVASRTTASATVRDAGNAALGTATAEVSEHIRPSFFFLSVSMMAPGGTAGAPLRGHVTRARFVTETGQLIAEIPTSTATLYVDAVFALNMNLPSRDEFDRVRGLILTNRTRVIIETDLPGRTLIETTLVGAHEGPSELGRCSPTA